MTDYTSITDGFSNGIGVRESCGQRFVQVKMFSRLSGLNDDASTPHRFGTNADDVHVIAMERLLQIR